MRPTASVRSQQCQRWQHANVSVSLTLFLDISSGEKGSDLSLERHRVALRPTINDGMSASPKRAGCGSRQAVDIVNIEH